MTIEIDIDEARDLLNLLKKVNQARKNACMIAISPDFCAELDNAISNYDEAAGMAADAAYYGGDGPSQKQAAAFAAARKDAGR